MTSPSMSNEPSATGPEAAGAPHEAPPVDLRLVLTTAPPGRATLIAKTLVEERLAACVNVVPGLRSIYRWQDAVADDPETLLIAKVTHPHVDALVDRVRDLHPYEVPEIVVLRPEAVDAAYAAWVRRVID